MYDDFYEQVVRVKNIGCFPFAEPRSNSWCRISVMTLTSLVPLLGIKIPVLVRMGAAPWRMPDIQAATTTWASGLTGVT